MEEQKHNPVVENNIQYSNDPQLTEVAALTARLRQLQRELEEAAQTAALKDGVIDELNQRVAERFVEICNRDSAVKGLSNQLDAERGKTHYLYREMAALRETLSQKESEIAKLSLEITELNGKLARRFVEICNRDSAVKGLAIQL